MESKSQILLQDLTLIDEDLNPFWNEVSQELHALLWLPRKIVSAGRVTASSSVSLNYREEKLDFWKKMLKAKTSTQHHFLASSQALSTLITENEQLHEDVIISKRIKIKPENPEKFFQACHTYRKAWNLTVEAIKERVPFSSELRREIVSKIKKMNMDVYNVNLIQEAYRKAKTTHFTILKLKKEGKPGYEDAEIGFMTSKYSPKYFVLMKLGKGGLIYPRQLGSVEYYEEIPDIAFGKNAIVNYKNGDWYISVQNRVDTEVVTAGSKTVTALDPGVRTFITSFNENEVSIYGENFVKEKLVPLGLKLRYLISQKDKLLALYDKEVETPQWFKDRKRFLFRSIAKTRARIYNLIDDLHKRVAYDLVQNYDVILMPSFKVSDMVKKTNEEGKKKRKIRKVTVREMISLKHYRFRQTLKWMARKYGKVIIEEVNEAYTSKTYNGRLMNIGGKKEFKIKLKSGKVKIIDRDVNGARNILLRYFTNHPIKMLT